MTTSDATNIILKFRKRRNKLFPGPFGKPAWDIMLSLAALGPAQPHAPISSNRLYRRSVADHCDGDGRTGRTY